MDIPKKKYKEIEDLIGSEESVVGIDAKKTHILIIHLLHQIQDRLEHLEQRMDTIEKRIS